MLIPLTKGKFAVVDDVDAAFVLQHKWYHHAQGKSQYALTTFWLKDQKRSIDVKMERVLLSPPDGMIVDHINGDGLDNRRCNLRLATKAENNRNRRTKNKNGYRGVAKDKHKFIARCMFERETHLGNYHYSALEAALEYDEMARRLHGEFAVTNFPDDGIL